MHNYESGDTVLLTISRQDKKLELPLYSHYTCIQGKSGSGKTHFLSYLNDHLSDGILIIENTLNAEVAVALDANTLSYLLRLPERMIIFADEASITHDSMLFSSINKSSHLLVIVCRADCFSVATSLQGLWSLEDTADWFKLQRMPEFPICSKICDQLATESASNKSEHLILSQFFSNIIPLSSSGNIASFIESCETDVLIFCDLGNISQEYFNITRALHNCCHKVTFYDYSCFEQLLFDSPAVQQLGYEITESVFDYMTIERYYESVLKHATKGTSLFYDHKKGLSKTYLALSKDDLFKSQVGKIIYAYLSPNTISLTAF